MSHEIKIQQVEILSDNWYLLKNTTFDIRLKDGSWQRQSRETYDRGNGATILLYNQEKKSVILTRQFRYPTYVNGNATGMLIEACAGLLDEEDPITCIKRETEEETGFRINQVEKVFEVYMSPGSVTEKLFFFIASYEDTMQVNQGGGVREEEENIEVLELPFEEAMHMIQTGEIRDAKTIMLLQHLNINHYFV